MDKYKVPSTLHIDQAKRLAGLIEENAGGGHEALSVIVEELKRFGRGEAGFEPTSISAYASKEEIEAAWAFVHREMEAIYQHVEAMDEDITNTQRAHEELAQKKRKQMATIENLHNDAKAIIDAENRIRTSSEFFLSDQNIDYDRIAGEPLLIRGGSVALPYASEPLVLNGNVRATIVPGTYTDGYGILGTESNGFPGNNHEVRKNAAQGLSTGVGMNGLSFIGESDRRADISVILDGNEQSHFEYERLSMRPTEQELIAKGMGLDYEVTDGKRIPYLDEGNEPLRLSVLLTLDEPKWLNEVDLRPFVPTNYGAKAPVVSDILVGAEYEPPVSVLKKKPKTNEWVFRFKPIFATTVIIKLEQDTGYPTDVGHIAYEIVKETEGQRLTIDTVDGLLAPANPIQIDGPALQVSDMGYLVDESKDGLKVAYTSQSIGNTVAKSMSESIRQLQSKINPKEMKMILKRIEGMRKVIGIRDILLKEAVYLDKGELVTKAMHFDEPITRVTLEADATPERNESGVEIKYHVSVDDGMEWHEIQPMNSELGDAPKLYRIVKDDSDVESEVPVIRSARDVYELRFKMTMERVGVSGQSGPIKVPDTPELFMYKMIAETEEPTRGSKMPSIMPPRRLKGNVIGGGGVVETDGGGPSFEEMPVPSLTLNVSKENCHNVPLTVNATFTHDKPVVEAVVYLDGKEVYREAPGVKEKEIRVDIPTSFFEDRSRISVSVMVSDGIKDKRELRSVLVVPCQDAGGRDIDVSASYPQAGQPWTVSGFARSETDIEKVTLFINGVEYPVESLGLTWNERKRVEFIKVFSEEEIGLLGFEVGQTIELKWVAKDIDAQEWDDILNLQYVDHRPPTIPCGQVTYLGVSYYDWNLGTFRTKGISVQNWEQEVKSFDDGRGVKTVIGWNELMAAPVFMVRNGIGETGGVIIGQVELRFKKLLPDNTLDQNETTVFMEGVLESDMTEGMDLAYGRKDLSAMQSTIHRTGRFTGMPRLMGLNAYLVPDFGSEYRSNVCGTGISLTSFDPTEKVLQAGEVEESGALCESNKMFFIEYYDKTIARRVLHGQKRDGQNPQTTIFLPGVEEHEVILKWSDTKTGVAVVMKSDKPSGLVVTSLGVLVESTRLESRYGQSYIESVGYTPEDTTFSVRKPSDPLEVADLYAEEYAVPELSGMDSKLFLGVKPRDMIACAVDPDDPGVKQDETPPEIDAETTLLTGQGGKYCLQDIPNGILPLTFTIEDDIEVASYEIYHNEALMHEDLDVKAQTTSYSREILLDKSKYTGTESQLMDKADIVFSVDTSGSMDPHITTVKQKMNEFKQYLIDNNVDAYIGAMDSKNPHSYLLPLTPAASADFSGLATNGGGWEANAWSQVTGAEELFVNARAGSKKVIVLVTDTYIGAVGSSASPAALTYVQDNDIQVSALAMESNRSQYETIINPSKGAFLDLSSNPDMSILAQSVGAVTGDGESFTVIATDKSGKMSTKTFKYDFMDCWDGTGVDEMIVTKSAFWLNGDQHEVFDQTKYITFDQLQQSNILEVQYRVRSQYGITQTGFNDWGTGITQVTGEYGPSIDVVNYSPEVNDTGLTKAQIHIPGVAGGPSYSPATTIWVEGNVRECIIVLDTRAEFMPYLEANKQKIVDMIKTDFEYGDTHLFKSLPYDKGQTPYNLQNKYWHYRANVKRRLHIMTIGTNGVEHRHYENPNDVTLDWVQERPDAVWGGASNKVFMDTLNKMSDFKGDSTIVAMNYIGYTLPALTTDADKEAILRPVMDIVEEQNVRIYCWTTSMDGTSPHTKLKWPTLDASKHPSMAPGSILMADVSGQDTMTFHWDDFRLREKMDYIGIKTGVIRRYILRYKTTQYTNGWYGGNDPIWVIVLDERFKANYAYTNGYTDNRATEVTE